MDIQQIPTLYTPTHPCLLLVYFYACGGMLNALSWCESAAASTQDLETVFSFRK